MMDLKEELEYRPGVRFWLPAACMDEKDLREEIQALYRRGFGRIESVVLGLPEEAAGSEDGWGGENWNRFVDIMEDETGKLGMHLDLAIGPGWPIASPVIQDAEDPAVLCELTWGKMELAGGTVYSGALPAGRVTEPEGKPSLEAVILYRIKKGNVLEKESFRDIRECVNENGTISLSVPGTGEERYVLFAFYRQPACQKINQGQTYVIDHLSSEGVEACRKYWDGVFRDHKLSHVESFFCDSLEYRTCMDWTPRMLQEFETRRGYSPVPYLPFIGADNIFPKLDRTGYTLDDGTAAEMADRDYMETLTDLYCEYHLKGLEDYAKTRGKTVRYQVGYNKMFDVVRCGLYVAIPENEALGRPAVDFQKTMAASVHLGRKKRYSFECAAEFGNAYGQDFEDLFWWIKRSYMAGMNAQVLHGASYSGGYHGRFSEGGFLKGTAWPGYEGFGKAVSNYWNRTLGEEHERACMNAVTEMNRIFRSRALVDCLIFRSEYTSDGLGSEYCWYPDDGKLQNAGYSYEYADESLLSLPSAAVKDHVLDPEGTQYRILIVPEQKYLSCEAIKQIIRLEKEGLPVLFIGNPPKTAKFLKEWDTEERRQSWKAAMQEMWNDSGALHAEDIGEVPGILQERGILPRIGLDGRKNIMTAVREGTKGEYWYALYRNNCAVFTPDSPNPEEMAVSAIYHGTKSSYHRPGLSSVERTEVTVEGEKDLYALDVWSGTSAPVCCEKKDGHTKAFFLMGEDEMVILTDAKDEESVHQLPWPWKQPDEQIAVRADSLVLYPFVPEKEGEKSFLRSRFSEEGKTYTLSRLCAFGDLDQSLVHFSGKGIYHAECMVQEKKKGRYILQLGDVTDTFSVKVNGEDAPFPDQVMKRVDITELLREGRNTIEITVMTNLYNAVRTGEEELFGGKIPYSPKPYGITEKDGTGLRIDYYSCIKDPVL